MVCVSITLCLLGCEFIHFIYEDRHVDLFSRSLKTTICMSIRINTVPRFVKCPFFVMVKKFSETVDIKGRDLLIIFTLLQRDVKINRAKMIKRRADTLPM